MTVPATPSAGCVRAAARLRRVDCQAEQPQSELVPPAVLLLLSVRWSAAKAAAGVPTVRVHDLRHTAASLWLAAGADPIVVQRVLGHATATMTMDLCGPPGGCQLVAGCAARRGTTGASELSEGGIRTDGGPEADTKTLKEPGFVGGAAHRNRTDDLRITRRITAVQHGPPVCVCPAQSAFSVQWDPR
jgi:hypothetical protein